MCPQLNNTCRLGTPCDSHGCLKTHPFVQIKYIPSASAGEGVRPCLGWSIRGDQVHVEALPSSQALGCHRERPDYPDYPSHRFLFEPSLDMADYSSAGERLRAWQGLGSTDLCSRNAAAAVNGHATMPAQTAPGNPGQGAAAGRVSVVWCLETCQHTSYTSAQRCILTHGPLLHKYTCW